MLGLSTKLTTTLLASGKSLQLGVALICGSFCQSAWQFLQDAFVSHASEDKNDIVRPLADALTARGLNIWYDDFRLTVGDSLRRSIDRGLAASRFGIVILSENFFSKEWPQRELDGLVAKETAGGKVILPIWHKITKDRVLHFSPTLFDTSLVDTNRSSTNGNNVPPVKIVVRSLRQIPAGWMLFKFEPWVTY